MCTRDFIMEIEEIDSKNPRGIMAIGKIKNGKVFLGDFLEIVGNNNVLKTHIAFIEKKINKNSDDKKSLLISNSAKMGEDVRLLLTNSRNDDISIGQIISTPKKIRPHKKFVAQISLIENETFCISKDESLKAEIAFGKNSKSNGSLFLLDNEKDFISTNSFCVTIDMDVPLAIGVNLNFNIYKWNEKIGVGNVVKIVE